MAEKEKPVCATCGQAHWRFTPCENREQADARERELAIQRDKLRVIPQPKHDPPQRRKFTSDKYVQVGPGRFALRREK